MKLFTRVLAGISSLALILSLAACQNSGSSSSDTSSESIPESSSVSSSIASLPDSSSVESTSSSAAPAGPVEGLGDTLEVFQISLDGVVYTFPGSTFADFEANGWEMDPGSVGATLPANTLTRVDYTKGEAKISLQASNTNAAATPINECTCIGLSIADKYKVATIDVQLPGGITIGSTADEVLAAYGEPREQYINSSDEVGSLTYGDSPVHKFHISFYEEALFSFDIYYR